MFRKIVLALAFVAMGLLAGCADKSTSARPVLPVPPDEKVLFIERILQNEPGHYTLWIQTTDTESVERYISWWTASQEKFIYKKDVPADQLMWLEAHWERVESVPFEGIGTPPEPLSVTVTFHIHTAQDVGGGGWVHHHGKFGTDRGQTSVIQ